MSEDLQTPETKSDSKARAAADKAYTKASRPWFKKKRFILALIVLLIIVISVATGGDDSDSAADTTTTPGTAGQAPAGESAAPAEAAPAEDAAPAFPGAEKSDVIGQAGEALVLGDITVTSTPMIDGDATLGATLCTNTTVQNASDKTIDFNSFDWKLQSPSGTIINATFMGSDNLLSSGQVAPGGTATGDTCFENKTGEAGQYVVLYEPILAFFSDRGAWINNR
ncbi:DUF4352 domain-containing protein [Arthrobacter jiangjiafuii]|uniref:DUF4352 domain-containing protein n=1 Tax=Arthrobacter jiangjiafuii TaxID=2817475 RepID=A0A975M6D5_9MICC|nr:DUF4352 domain-containing protein [Arthrobacter jiangjiafuii]MBP3043715.1 DUF4352 domain-containing protein [Arthrobacter jiangjiafuii]QWC10747.1 DUF4352 domain-containing protein [Arthrobacter jiangjiafuii]